MNAQFVSSVVVAASFMMAGAFFGVAWGIAVGMYKLAEIANDQRKMRASARVVTKFAFRSLLSLTVSLLAAFVAGLAWGGS